MLAVQEFLQEQHNSDIALSKLAEKGIKSKIHENNRLVLLNYDMVEAEKSCPIVRNCRGLVLEYGTWKLVGRGFDRFFNMQEMLQLHKYFNWDDFYTTSKEDGTLINVWRYDGKVHINTRGTFGDGNVNDTNLTWRQLVEKVIDLDTIFRLPLELNASTLVFELVSPYNKIVRQYNETQLYLLSVFRGEDEVVPEISDSIADFIQVKRPERYSFKSQYEVEKFIKEKEETDPTYEGVVLCDSNKLRMKVKSLAYLALSRLRGNGNLATPKEMVPLILMGETSEITTYFPEFKEQFEEVQTKLNIEFGQLMTVWNEVKYIKEQKEFALTIIPRTRFNSILFLARRDNKSPAEIWRESSALILKVLF